MKEIKIIRVMIVDDHTIVREGLATLLDAFPVLMLVGEASDGLEAVQRYEEFQPDVILMDLAMPVMDGVTAIREIMKKDPEIKILALTSFIENEMVTAALEAGAKGYLLKDISAQKLTEAIKSVIAGKHPLAPEATRAVIQASIAPPPIGHDLTQREREVLELMAQGMTNDQIAHHLQIQPATVKNHVSNIYSKLGTSTRTEAVVLAIRHNIIQES